MAVNYHGDVKADQAMGANLTMRVKNDSSDFEAKQLDYKAFSFSYPNPSNGGAIGMRVYQNMAILSVAGCVTGTSTPSIDVQINKRTAPQTSGTNLMLGALTLDTNGAQQTSFATGTVSADDWLYIDLSNKSGTVSWAMVTLTFQLS